MSVAAVGKGYWEASRSPRYSMLFALPLLVLYEVLAAALSAGPGGTGFRNGADVLLRDLAYTAGGQRGPTILMGLVIAGALWWAVADIRKKGRPEPRVFALMFGESAALAALFGLVIGLATAKLLGAVGGLATMGVSALQAGGSIEQAGVATRLMLSLGAGLYEELLFRVVLVGALAALGRAAFGMSRRGAGIMAVVVGALAFSAFHYIGPYGDPWRLDSFTFRALAGVAFSAMYLIRGFGITAWTHAIYDVYVLVL